MFLTLFPIFISFMHLIDHHCLFTPENLLLYYQEHVERSSDLQKTWKREMRKKRNIPTRMH